MGIELSADMCGGSGNSPSVGRASVVVGYFFRSTVTAHAATDGFVGTLAVWRADASVLAGKSYSLLLGSRCRNAVRIGTVIVVHAWCAVQRRMAR